MKKILVVGSAIMDMVKYLNRYPECGETITCHEFLTNPGGKGANQAVAVAKMGGNVTFLGKVGNDDYGRILMSTLKENNVDTKLIIDDATPTGIASIIVEKKTAENTIIVYKGANDRLSVQDIDNNIDLIEKADLILLQLEVPVETVEYVINIANSLNKTIILNPAPAIKVNEQLLKKVTYLTPNRFELSMLTGMEVASIDDIYKACNKLLEIGVKKIIVTLGKEGSLLYEENNVNLVPSIKVTAIDTTGAGDCYNGTFAVCKCLGLEDIDSMKIATKASSLCVTKSGAMRSMPTKEEVF